MSEMTELNLATLVTRPGVSLYRTTKRQVKDHESTIDVIDARSAKAIIDDWQLISLHHHETAQVMIHLIGQVRGTQKTRLTSRVSEIDLARNLVVTQNSLYRMGSKGEGEPSPRQLLAIIYVFGVWGIADSLGMPRILLGGCE